MSSGEDAADRGSARDEQDQRGQRADRIGVGGGDDSVTRIQLAARWAEAYGRGNDSLGTVLKRFRAAYEYLDAVTHGVEPAELDPEVAGPLTPAAAPVAGPALPPTASVPQPESRPWG